MAAIVLLSACSQSETEVAYGYEDVASLPTLYTRDVNTLISDSGVIRYHLEAPTWYMYEREDSTSYWLFPDGIFVEQYDSLFAREAMIEGDSAIYYKDKQLWRIDRNVHIENSEGRQFDTQQLFWDQKERVVYTDSAVCITSEDEIIEGVGFLSNEQITKYTILQVTGIITVESDSVRSQNPAETESAEMQSSEATSPAGISPSGTHRHTSRANKPQAVPEMQARTLPSDTL